MADDHEDTDVLLYLLAATDIPLKAKKVFLE